MIILYRKLGFNKKIMVVVFKSKLSDPAHKPIINTVQFCPCLLFYTCTMPLPKSIVLFALCSNIIFFLNVLNFSAKTASLSQVLGKVI